MHSFTSHPLMLAAFGLMAATGCAQTTHDVSPAEPLGVPASSSWSQLVAQLEEAGPIELEKHVAADWAVPRSGLINLKHEHAKEAHLEDGPEAIQVYFYIAKHPQHGDYMIDSGIARSVAERSEEMPLKWPVTSAMPMDEMHVRLDTKTYMESRSSPLSGVFLTHLHLDHILGLQDVPKDVPLYVGPGETKDNRFTHMLVRPTTNLNLKGFPALGEWQVKQEAGAPLGYVDIFGDGSMLGLHIPGHTRGNMAFLMRTTNGPQLIVGDGSHTAWGWENQVEPGTYNTDGKEAAASLASLKQLVATHPEMIVHLGHQEVGDGASGLKSPKSEVALR